MAGGSRKIRLWDPLLRGFHWSLAFFVTLSWCLGQFGPAKMTLHFWSGYVIAGLLVFRLIWGFVGPPAARFSHFLRGPGAIRDYASRIFLRQPSYWPGHNPLGALSVIAMLAVPILIQVFFNSSLAYWLNKKAGEKHSVACPSALIGASNFFELAVAAAISLFGFESGAALATVVGVLIEVPVMLLVVKVVNASKGWYENERA